MKRGGFHWTSQAGKEAVKRLDAYGELRRWELAGEVAAITTASGGGSRGKPGDMPGSFHRAWDVELTLREWSATGRVDLLAFPAAGAAATLMPRLVDHMWTHGRERRVVEVEFVMTNDPELRAEMPPIRMTPEEESFRGAPGRHVARIEHEAIVSTYVLDLFEDERLDAVVSYLCTRGRGEEAWWETRRSLLEWHHGEFAAFMAERRGLGEYGDPSMPGHEPRERISESEEADSPQGLPLYGVATQDELDAVA